MASSIRFVLSSRRREAPRSPRSRRASSSGMRAEKRAASRTEQRKETDRAVATIRTRSVMALTMSLQPSPTPTPTSAAPHRGGDDDRDQPRPVAAHRRVRPPDGGLHRGPPRRALLRLPGPLHAPRADLRLRALSGAHGASPAPDRSPGRRTPPRATHRREGHPPSPGSSKPDRGTEAGRPRRLFALLTGRLRVTRRRGSVLRHPTCFPLTDRRSLPTFHRL